MPIIIPLLLSHADLVFAACTYWTDWGISTRLAFYFKLEVVIIEEAGLLSSLRSRVVSLFPFISIQCDIGAFGHSRVGPETFQCDSLCRLFLFEILTRYIALIKFVVIDYK